MTEAEITRELKKKWPSQRPEAKAKSKLKMRYATSPEKLRAEIAKTLRRLEVLTQLWFENWSDKR